MMDEFAQYAKTERKINKLTEKLNQCSSADLFRFSKYEMEMYSEVLMKN